MSGRAPLRCLALAGALLGVLSVAGCAGTPHQEATALPREGFLGAALYARMQPGTGPNAPAFAYADRSVDARRYTSVVIEPVQLWRAPGTTDPFTPEQRQLVLDQFFAALRTELAKDFRVVTQPGPDTMVIATAITQAQPGANPMLSNVASFVPQARLVRNGVTLPTGSDPLTGSASGEIKVTDAMTGALLGAAIDRREAVMGVEVRTSRWDDVETITQYWARLIRFRLCRAQQKPDCPVPSHL